MAVWILLSVWDRVSFLWFQLLVIRTFSIDLYLNLGIDGIELIAMLGETKVLSTFILQYILSVYLSVGWAAKLGCWHAIIERELHLRYTYIEVHPFVTVRQLKPRLVDISSL